MSPTQTMRLNIGYHVIQDSENQAGPSPSHSQNAGKSSQQPQMTHTEQRTPEELSTQMEGLHGIMQGIAPLRTCGRCAVCFLRRPKRCTLGSAMPVCLEEESFTHTGFVNEVRTRTWDP